jgi:hypothetical protein
MAIPMKKVKCSGDANCGSVCWVAPDSVEPFYCHNHIQKMIAPSPYPKEEEVKQGELFERLATDEKGYGHGV